MILLSAALFGSSILMFAISLIMLGKSKQLYGIYKPQVEELHKLFNDNVNLCKQLFTFYSSLEESHKLQLKAFEVMVKHQKLTSGDLYEFKEQVSTTLVALVEQLNKSGSMISNSEKSKDRKPN